MTRQDAVIAVREALRAIPPVAQASATEQPDTNLLVTPRAHSRALDPREMVVEGDRGVGKSFWSSVLTFNDARISASTAYPALQLDRLVVSLGFAQARRTEYPSAAVLKTLGDIPPATIWRLVALRAAAVAVDINLPVPLNAEARWSEAALYLDAHPEEEEAIFSSAQERLSTRGRRLLIIFDALDRIGGTDWTAVRRLVRGILQSGLELRDSFPAIRYKVFLRSDIFNDDEIWRFPDASKIKGAAARLTWNVTDLYALLFRQLSQNDADTALKFLQPRVRLDRLTSDVEEQQLAFESMAGEFMGGVRRGRVFTWLPSHLSDARGEASPRSFLLALKTAAENTVDSLTLPLSYLAVRDSVQLASQIRVSELNEDHPWLSDVLRSLDGLIVPAERSEVSARFGGLQAIFARKLVQDAATGAGDDPVPRVPVELAEADITPREFNERLLLALRRLHVIEERPDKRVNVPDLFRVAAGIKRKGGVPAIRGA